MQHLKFIRSNFKPPFVLLENRLELRSRKKDQWPTHTKKLWEFSVHDTMTGCTSSSDLSSRRGLKIFRDSPVKLGLCYTDMSLAILDTIPDLDCDGGETDPLETFRKSLEKQQTLSPEVQMNTSNENEHNHLGLFTIELPKEGVLVSTLSLNSGYMDEKCAITAAEDSNGFRSYRKVLGADFDFPPYQPNRRVSDEQAQKEVEVFPTISLQIDEATDHLPSRPSRKPSLIDLIVHAGPKEKKLSLQARAFKLGELKSSRNDDPGDVSQKPLLGQDFQVGIPNKVFIAAEQRRQHLLAKQSHQQEKIVDQLDFQYLLPTRNRLDQDSRMYSPASMTNKSTDSSLYHRRRVTESEIMCIRASTCLTNVFCQIHDRSSRSADSLPYRPAREASIVSHSSFASFSISGYSSA